MSALVLLLIGLGFYCIPLVVAQQRRHRNTMAIGALNILLGWTFLGWVAALVWACTDNVMPQVPVPPEPEKPRDILLDEIKAEKARQAISSREPWRG